MLLGLDKVVGRRQALPFVRLFYSEPSAYLWEDDAGTVHTIHQGEGGEQGDPLMPLLFSLGQPASLEALQRRMRPTERLMAYLDDIYFASRPERVGDVVAASVQELWAHARIRVHGGKTHIWNRAGTKPRVCDILQRQTEETDPDARVWRGSEVPTTEQGIKVLGTPLGHEDFVNQHLERTRQKHRKLLRRIPTLPDVQSAWLLLLHCASTRANYLLRVVRPEWALEFARTHDQEVCECLCHILTVPTGPESVARASTTLPLAMGGLGLRSAERTRWPAYWASWADTLPMIRERHPEMADLIVYHLEGGASSPCLGSACRAATTLNGVDGFEVPSWSAVTAGQRPPIMEVEDREPGVPRQGWQHAAAIRIESSFPDRNSDAQDESRGTGTVEVTEWAVCWGRLLCLSQLSTHANRLSFVPGASPAPPPSPSSFVPAHLRVWPATRSFWPSPRSMFEDWGFGKKGLRSGECGRQSLQGSWGQSRDEHVCARHGLGGACGWRQQALGSGC